MDGPRPPDPLIQLRRVEKVYETGRLKYPALRGVDLTIGAGEFVSIVGPSGSGKSTILNVLTGIDRPTSGDVTVAGAVLNDMTEEQLAVWRGEHVGLIFQFFQLLPTLTAVENCMLPMDFARLGTVAERDTKARHDLALVGLADKADHLPLELSGGEQQRVAIARALACNPSLLVADEPTGNLDTETADQILELLAKLNAEGTTVLYVTHDPRLAAFSDRVVTVRDGVVVSHVPEP